MAGIFDNFLEQLIPAMGSGIRQWNIGTEPIRDYFNPVLGLGDPERHKQLVSALTGGQTARQVLLGELGDLKFQQGIDQALDAAGGIASFVGDIQPDILSYLFQKPYPSEGEFRERQGPGLGQARNRRGRRKKGTPPPSTIPNYTPGRA
ncbi:hypothetical protein LCGC14_0491130 [marine sediment metagenome]|uniref:Uncharacterized protein n=1 Tax=marine sediment metagenome TaxID=412755 RepID=A0A0F9S6K0_9ZZZZ